MNNLIRLRAKRHSFEKQMAEYSTPSNSVLRQEIFARVSELHYNNFWSVVQSLKRQLLPKRVTKKVVIGAMLYRINVRRQSSKVNAIFNP